MKRVTLGFSVLVLSALVIISCKKPKDNVVPETDTEVQSSVDAVWATFVVSDVETICSLLGERQYPSNFYAQAPAVAGGSVTPLNDTIAKVLSMSYSNTACMDGRRRDGTIVMKYGNFTEEEKKAFIPNQVGLNKNDALYTRSYGFGGFISFSEYKVDGWRISLMADAALGIIRNEVKNPGYNPKETKLTWTIKGQFKIAHPSNPALDMTWDGTLTKTCENSTSATTFSATTDHKKDGPIIWKKAVVSYSGIVSGLNGGVPYTMTVSSASPIIRDYTCFPDSVGNVIIVNNSLTIVPQEFHPFKSGIATFKTINSKGVEVYPRQIYFGAEGNSVDGLSDAQCDNSGEVYIKGVSYKVNFRK
jgi:hypothetical protein